MQPPKIESGYKLQTIQKINFVNELPESLLTQLDPIKNSYLFCFDII